MKTILAKTIGVSIALGLLLLAGCNTTSVENAWVAPDVSQIRFNKIMVVATSPDGALRRTAEEAMKAQVQRVECVTSYSLLGAESDLKDIAKVAATLKTAGVDGVVVVRPVCDRNEITYVPGQPMPLPYRTFRGYYARSYGLNAFFYEPGYFDTTRVVKLETNIYEVAGERLIWSGVTTSTNPGNTNQLVQDTAKAIRAELIKQKLMPAN